MKKYILSISAIVLAVIFSAFTTSKPNFVDKKFKYTATVFQASDVEALTNWEFNSGQTCSGSLSAPCTILVDDIHYHLDAEDNPVLNDATFIASNRSGTPDATDELMTIASENGNLSGIKKVATTGTTAVTVSNKTVTP